jgi:hypothetical protein
LLILFVTSCEDRGEECCFHLKLITILKENEDR